MIETVFLCLSLLGMVVYSFYEAQYIPDCWPDGRTDLRYLLGFIGLVMLMTPANGIGLLIFYAIAIGTVPGMIYLPLKERRIRWRERPNKLLPEEHRTADKLESEVNTLIHKVGLPYTCSKGATAKGLESLMAPARLKAREYFALTGLNIERRIDMWLTIEAMASNDKEGELQA